jgi:hypothetical protein
MPPFVSTAPLNKPESAKTINVPAARSLRNAKRIKRKRLLSGKNNSSFHKKATKATFTVMLRGNQAKIMHFRTRSL